MAKVLAFGFAGLAAAQLQPGDVTKAFEQFIIDFGKQYSDDAERSARFDAFAANYNHILAENAKGHSYTLGINKFADMTSDEFLMSYTGLRTDRPRELWGNAPYLGRHQLSNRTLPQSVDWRKKGAVTPVKNQAQCGSCWAFSSTGAMEGAWAIHSGKLVSVSEQQLVDCSKKFGEMGCNGGMMDGAFEYAEQTDMCTEESYPYKAKNGVCRASTCTSAIPKGSITGYKDVAHNDVTALMDAVAQQPTSVAIEADQMAFQLYKGGVLEAKCGTNLDHGVLAVGYGTDAGKDYWLVKNSWGPSFGEEGYVRLARGKPGAGECGIKAQPSYPVAGGSPAPPAPPAPPSPPSPPSPPAPPAKSHYEKPPCQSDETSAEVEGADGSLCAPSCDGGASCPTDVPEGTRAKPQCILQDSSSGKRYCALQCMLPGSCPSGAKCARIGGFFGVCVYPDSEYKWSANLTLQVAQSEITV